MNVSSFWESIPAPIRTVINVVAGAAFAAGIGYVVDHISGGSIDVSALVSVILTAAGTALVKAINPADTSYGVGSTVPEVPAGVPDVAA